MVRKWEDGRWAGRLVVCHKDNGDSIFQYFYADIQKELTAKLRQHIDIYQGVDLTKQSRMTLAEWFAQWQENITGTVRPTTLTRYWGAVRIHINPSLGGKPIGQVTGKDIQKLYDALASQGNQITGRGLASNTIRGISMFHEALDTAKQAGLIPRNSTEDLPTPKFTFKPKRILTDEQLDTFMEAIRKGDVWYDLLHRTYHRPAAGRDLRPQVGGLRRGKWYSQGAPRCPSGEGRQADYLGLPPAPTPSSCRPVR